MARFRFMLCLALLSLAGSLQAAPESACEAKDAANDNVGFKAECAGKLECTATDTLEVKAAKPTDAGPAAVCLRFADGTRLDLKLRTDTKPSPPATFALAMLFREKLEGTDAKAVAKALKQAKDLRQRVTVVALNDAGQVSEKALQLDTTALWTASLLRPEATEVVCDAPCRLRSPVTVTVPGLATWSSVTKADPNKLVLVVNDVRLPGLVPLWKSSEDKLGFRLWLLGDKADNVAAWTSILENVPTEGAQFRIGLADDKSVITTATDKLKFEPWGAYRGAVMLAALAVLAVFIALYGVSNGGAFIRDDDYGLPATAYTDAGLMGPPPRPYSLGRSQMLFWTVVVAAATITIGLSTGDYLNFNETALILLGMGTGTALGSIAVGVPKAVADQLAVYQAEKKAGGANLQREAASLVALVTSTGCWSKDVSTDHGDGRAGIHRLQNMLATAGFGVWFLYLAYRQATMPVFTTTQLTLLGISSGAYLGFKLAGKPS